MTSDRIQEIQQETAFPNSQSVQQALLKVWNECGQETAKLQAELEKAKELLREFERGKNGKLNFQEINDFQDKVTTFLDEGKK